MDRADMAELGSRMSENLKALERRKRPMFRFVRSSQLLSDEAETLLCTLAELGCRALVFPPTYEVELVGASDTKIANAPG